VPCRSDRNNHLALTKGNVHLLHYARRRFNVSAAQTVSRHYHHDACTGEKIFAMSGILDRLTTWEGPYDQTIWVRAARNTV
jgi:hypothetical protein